MKDKRGERACWTCVYAVAGELDQNTLKRPIICRRGPPSLVAVPSPQGLAMVAMWPQMDPNAYCFEYRPDASDPENEFWDYKHSIALPKG